MKQVYCLYRVSTVQQLREDDIPMQRQACREFAATHQWGIIKELYEKGISGFKTPIQDRKVLQQIKKDAELRKFDILLVFMFDRLGRRDSETPFFVEDLSMYGVEIWSVTEGQQQFESHADKLINYIRYWQAESLKTSDRIKTRMGQLTVEGFFCGGRCAYGYQLIKTWRKNDRGHEIHDLAIQPDEAAVIQKIFDYRIHYGYGSRKIAAVLAEQNIYNRNGEKFHFSSIRGILEREQYAGRLVWGDHRSDDLPELKIISSETLAVAQQIAEQRKTRQIPQRISGQALLSGNVYCGHCGGKIFASTARKSHHSCAEVSERVPIYKCYNRTQYKGRCFGPTSYRAQKIDEYIQEELRQYFERNKSSPQIRLLAKDWVKAELPAQKMMLIQIIERVSIFGNMDIRIVFRESAML